MEQKKKRMKAEVARLLEKVNELERRAEAEATQVRHMNPLENWKRIVCLSPPASTSDEAYRGLATQFGGAGRCRTVIR